MTATPHEHITEIGSGTCTICFGEGFLKCSELAKDLFTRMSKSTLDLKDEMDKSHLVVVTSLARLKAERGAGPRL